MSGTVTTFGELMLDGARNDHVMIVDEDRYSVRAARCLACNHISVPTSVTSDVFRKTCSFRLLNDEQKAIVYRLREADLDPSIMRPPHEGWMHVRLSPEPSEVSHRREGRFYSPEGHLHTRDSMRYRLRLERVRPAVAAAIASATHMALTLWLDENPDDGDPHWQEYRDMVGESIEAAIESAFVQPLDDNGRPIASYTEWYDSQAEAAWERAQEARMG